ncbi:MAG TPA: hypothetical protein VHQ65_10445 [Thermoanaerobaculia bacterium]|nr:hypothetical protein [Thermoanaerobaculia bacterium]
MEIYNRTEIPIHFQQTGFDENEEKSVRAWLPAGAWMRFTTAGSHSFRLSILDTDCRTGLFDEPDALVVVLDVESCWIRILVDASMSSE